MKSWLIIALLLAAPALHPLLIPWVGVPSHLMWWVHVLPVALVAFYHGRYAGAGMMAVSTVLVVWGERAFGAGYGVAATWETAWALAVSVFATHILVAGFALHARSTARRYQLLFDHAVSAILRTDDRGRILAANPAATRLLGVEWASIRGRRVDELPGMDRLPAPEQMIGTGWSGTVSAQDGECLANRHVTVIAVAEQDPEGYQLLLVDRTEEVLRERELERQGRLAVLGSTLAGVAHELKNPLQVIMGHAELALGTPQRDPDTRESLDIIQEQAHTMRDLIGELLGFSRPGADAQAIPLADTVRRIVALQQVSYGRGITLEEDVEWTGLAQASAVRVEQILANLISNAVDAVEEGHPVIRVGVRREGGQGVISVADNGPGIEPELLDRIFDPFVTSKDEGAGTGLGLAISRRLASAMGGSLTGRTHPGGGAVFELRIPVQGADSTAPAEPMGAAS